MAFVATIPRFLPFPLFLHLILTLEFIIVPLLAASFQECSSPISHFSQQIFCDDAQGYVPLSVNTSRNLVSQNAEKNQNPRIRNLTRIGSLLGFGVAASVYFCNLETIPYIERTHFVLMSSYLERRVGGFLFELYKSKEFEGKILPIDHPESIRVRKIGHDIIGAFHKGLMRKEGIDLDQHKHMSMKKKKKKSQTAHLEEFEWEFIVVDDTSISNAYCFPGGKIVLFTGLLNDFESDAEIATTIGHEVGHAVARHSAEEISRILWLELLQSIMPDAVKKISDRFVRLPLFWRDELEADYIGLLLMASAGYDPRVAIEVYEKFDLLEPLDDEEDHLSTHPSGKERAQLLSEPKVMEEALSLYREALKEKKAKAEREIMQWAT